MMMDGLYIISESMFFIETNVCFLARYRIKTHFFAFFRSVLLKKIHASSSITKNYRIVLSDITKFKSHQL